MIIIILNLKSYAFIPNDVGRFKNENDCIKCNLTGSSFSSSFKKIEKSAGKYEGAFFTKISLSNYMINNSNFYDANFVQSYLNKNEFNNSMFQKVNISYSHLSDIKFIKSFFKNVNFTHVSMDGSFVSCSLQQVDFTESDLSDVAFTKTNIVDSSFDNANLRNANFSRVHFENVSFNNADLSYSILLGSDINEAKLSTAKSYKCAILPNGDIYTNNGEYECKQPFMH